ncbi:DUF1275 family protein [Planotetraspora thailandica]|uniref:DUF1275 family protein n=1 Tax=Planotetraspora thailandica TaxID=487172 RepID=A0A8J3XZZ4_9ACTN|nr:DUF1275 family protein [Planotetraspora thailandica]GII58284.1 DUF1275 family protein [Planotetraspora thailandica]
MGAVAAAAKRAGPAPPGPLALATALTLATGATNAISFFGLGGVFTSVMTGNLVLLGLSIGRYDLPLAANAAGAIIGFIVGVLGGSRVIGRAGPSHPRWGTRVALVLGAELVLFAWMLGDWAVLSGPPTGTMRFAHGALAALAMGAQSAVIRTFGIPGLSTTFFTGTLTGVVAGLVIQHKMQWDNILLLASVVAGAAAGGWMVVHATPAAPAIPTALLVVTLAGLHPLAVRPGRTEVHAPRSARG